MWLRENQGLSNLRLCGMSYVRSRKDWPLLLGGIALPGLGRGSAGAGLGGWVGRGRPGSAPSRSANFTWNMSLAPMGPARGHGKGQRPQRPQLPRSDGVESSFE